MASVAIECEGSSAGSDKKVNEIDQFVNQRFITASESFWRICGFDMQGRYPSIQRLDVHEENL